MYPSLTNDLSSAEIEGLQRALHQVTLSPLIDSLPLIDASHGNFLYVFSLYFMPNYMGVGLKPK